VNPSTALQFVLALVLLPPILRIGRGIRLTRGRQAFVLGMLLIILGFGMQLVGPLVPWTGLRFLRHLVLGAGGFALAWAAWSAGRAELQTAERSSAERQR
jgi:hypothetical protein